MRRDEAYFLDILNAARRALRFVDGVSLEEFESNELLQNAVMRPLEIIGEAAHMVSEQARLEHNDIPWELMVGMRNRLVHEYFQINLHIVWETIHKDLPPLIDLIEPIIPHEDR